MGAEGLVNDLLDKALGDTEIKDPVYCPFCQRAFDSLRQNRFNYHIRQCGLKTIQVNKSCDLFPPSQDIELFSHIQNNYKKYTVINNNRNNLNFDLKIQKLKSYLETRKIDWKQGCRYININRQNILKETIEQIDKINLFQELKINFIGEVSIDAGGVLREFFTTIFHTLEGPKLKLFTVSETDDFSYILNPFLLYNAENYKYLDLIGKLIAKALLQNVTVGVCFNKLIYKMLLQEEIKFNDLFFIDETLYSSLKNIKEYDALEELCLTFSVEMKDINDHIHSFELIEEGRKKMILTKKDLEKYINCRINFLIGLYEPLIARIRNSLFNVIPKNIIIMFNSDEFELLLNGRPYIDLDEWNFYTVYEHPYHAKHKIIEWFWQNLEELTQKELSNLLLFTTGSSRVPLGGFAELESNRGKICKFTIECIPYDKKQKNFLKAHTCFNRLDIPLFPNKKELKEAIKFVTKNEIYGFGID